MSHRLFSSSAQLSSVENARTQRLLRFNIQGLSTEGIYSLEINSCPCISWKNFPGFHSGIPPIFSLGFLLRVSQVINKIFLEPVNGFLQVFLKRFLEKNAIPTKVSSQFHPEESARDLSKIYSETIAGLDPSDNHIYFQKLSQKLLLKFLHRLLQIFLIIIFYGQLQTFLPEIPFDIYSDLYSDSLRISSKILSGAPSEIIQGPIVRHFLRFFFQNFSTSFRNLFS